MDQPVTACPSCLRELPVAVTADCPYCGVILAKARARAGPNSVVEPAPAAPVIPPPPPADATPMDPHATRRCPFCAEEILAAAVKCKHCGSDLSFGQTPATIAQRKFADATGSSTGVVLLVLGLLFLFASGVSIDAAGLLVLDVIVSAFWVYFDAKRIGEATGRRVRGSSPGAWALIIALIWIVGLPLYVFSRRKLMNELERPAQSG